MPSNHPVNINGSGFQVEPGRLTTRWLPRVLLNTVSLEWSLCPGRSYIVFAGVILQRSTLAFWLMSARIGGLFWRGWDPGDLVMSDVCHHMKLMGIEEVGLKRTHRKMSSSLLSSPAWLASWHATRSTCIFMASHKPGYQKLLQYFFCSVAGCSEVHSLFSCW
jgi:hypothetical protein